jgi:methylenetetrahydrofolate reductase (NADPH)
LRCAPAAATAPIAGFHLFPFGGLRKAGDWLRNYDRDPLGRERAAMSSAGLQNP